MKKIHMIMNILPILEKIIKKSPTRDFFFYLYSYFIVYKKSTNFYVYNNVKLHCAVPFAKQTCTCGKATFVLTRVIW